MENINEIRQLLKIVNILQNKYRNRKFTLDGRLVGDLGEIIVQQNYDVQLFNKQEKTYDGISGNRKIQIKTTFKNFLSFPYGKENIPDYYIGIKLFENGDFEEIYNGLGINIYKLIENRKKPKNGYYSIKISTLKKENLKVLKKDRIKNKNKSNGT